MDRTGAYRRAAFARYYAGAEPLLPPRFGRREFGFLFFDRGGMQRHTGFGSGDALTTFLRERVPEHCYYSSAYYETPDAASMSGKGWLGADLIFDLDADHLDLPPGTPYPVMLQRCRDEAVKLVEDFLMGDFGLDEDDMEFAFSGGRGYHVHVRDPRVFPLDSSARREIVDYIVGQGLDPEAFLEARAVEKRTYGDRVQLVRSLRLPSPDDPGWPGRMARALVAYLEELLAMPEEEAVEELVGLEGVGETRARALLDKLRRDDGSPALDRVREGRLDLDTTFKSVAVALLDRASVDVEGETDEPVTTDTKRLIRLQGSLHGKSGLRVSRLTLDEMRGYDPLTDAVVFGDDPVRVRGLRDAKLGMKGELHDVEEGAERSLPECAALLASGIGMVEVLDAPRPPGSG